MQHSVFFDQYGNAGFISKAIALIEPMVLVDCQGGAGKHDADQCKNREKQFWRFDFIIADVKQDHQKIEAATAEIHQFISHNSGFGRIGLDAKPISQ